MPFRHDDRDLVLELAIKHVERYARYLDHAKRGTMLGRSVNVDESTALLNVWKGVLDKGCEWSKFSADERNEVYDAIVDDFDEDEITLIN